MKREACVSAIAIALGCSVGAAAQTIEISSASLGTIVVTPPPINAKGGSSPATVPRSARARAVTATGAGRTGVDLGVRRRHDGTLYDPLDPAQNPAAATVNVAPSAGDARVAGSGLTAGSPGGDVGNPGALGNQGGAPAGGPYGNVAVTMGTGTSASAGFDSGPSGSWSGNGSGSGNGVGAIGTVPATGFGGGRR